jgi:ABC-type glycerol-3-phosphate transport system substrate-binding protein
MELSPKQKKIGDTIVMSLSVLSLVIAVLYHFRAELPALTTLDMKETVISLNFAQFQEKDVQSGIFTPLVNKWNRDNPKTHVTLVYMPWAEIRDAILAAGIPQSERTDTVASQTSQTSQTRGQNRAAAVPDIILLDWTQTRTLAGRLTPVPDPATGRTADALPLLSFINPLFYNIDALADAGFNHPPKDRDEFFEYAQRLRQINDSIQPVAFSSALMLDTMPWFWSVGVTNLSKPGESFEARSARDTFTLLRRLYDAGLMGKEPFTSRGDEIAQNFAAGKIGMVVASGFLYHRLTLESPDFRFGITAIPQETGYKGSPVLSTSTWYAALPASAGNGVSATQFINFLLENRAGLSDACLAVPGSGQHSLFTGNEPEERQQLLQKAQDLYNNAEPAPAEDAFFHNPLLLEEVLSDELNALFSGEKTVDQAARSTQRRLE